MPRTKNAPSHQANTSATSIAKKIKNKILNPTPKPSTPSTEEKVKKKKPRFRPITSALRGIRRMQRSTEPCVRKTGFRLMVKQMVAGMDTETWLRDSTVDALREIVEANVHQVLSQALDRRVEALSNTERKKQTLIQVMDRNVVGAFKTWSDMHHGSDFFTDFVELRAQTKL